MNRFVFAAAALAAFASSIAAGEAPRKDIEKAIEKLNKAFESGNAEEVLRLMTNDHVAVTPYYDGPLSRAAQIKSLPDHKLTEYSAKEMKIAMLDKNAALITYSLRMKGSYRGQPLPVLSFASAIWVNRDGAWREAFYQETPLKGE